MLARTCCCWAGLLVAFAACGRFGFDTQAQPPDGDVDAALPPDADSSVTPALIDCDEPARFQVDAEGVSAIDVIATSTGFALFTHRAAVLAGWSYEWNESGGLSATAENVELDSDMTATFGAATMGDDVVLTAVTAAGSTRVYPLTNRMSARGAPVLLAQSAGITPIAASGSGTELAIITIDATSTEGELRAITTLGAPSAAPLGIVSGSESPGSVSIRPAEDGFVVAWSAATPSPNALRLELADPTTGVTLGPITANTSVFDPLRPQVLWAKTSNIYLVTWFEKNETDNDDIWIQLLGADFEPITEATIIANFGSDPVIASDGTSFLLSYLNYAATPQRLESVRISSTGDVATLPSPMTTGGTPQSWAMLERAGQPILAWLELGGSGPDLWLAALCP